MTQSLLKNPQPPAETWSKNIPAKPSQAPLPPVVEWPESGFLAIRHFVNRPGVQIGLIPVAQSTFLKWVADGFAPKPVKFGKRVTVWKVEDLREFAEKLSEGAAS